MIHFKVTNKTYFISNSGDIYERDFNDFKDKFIDFNELLNSEYIDGPNMFLFKDKNILIKGDGTIFLNSEELKLIDEHGINNILNRIDNILEKYFKESLEDEIINMVSPYGKYDVSGDNNLDYIDVTLKYKSGYEETKTLKEVIENLDIDIEYPKTIEDEYILVTYNNNEYKLYVDIYDSELGASFITNAGIMYLNNLYSINDLFKGNKTYINPVGVLIDGHEYYSLEELKDANLNVETYNYNIIGAIPTVKEFIEVIKNDSFIKVS